MPTYVRLLGRPAVKGGSRTLLTSSLTAIGCRAARPTEIRHWRVGLSSAYIAVVVVTPLHACTHSRCLPQWCMTDWLLISIHNMRRAGRAGRQLVSRRRREQWSPRCHLAEQGGPVQRGACVSSERVHCCPLPGPLPGPLPDTCLDAGPPPAKRPFSRGRGESTQAAVWCRGVDCRSALAEPRHVHTET